MTKYSVKRPFTIFVAVIIILIFGGVSMYKMTPDLFPNVNTPYAAIMTTYPGASAEEVEKQLTEPMEKSLATLTNIKNVYSVSADNYSLITLEFNNGVNMDTMSVDIREKLNLIEGLVPDSASTPVVLKMNMDMMPVTVAAVSIEGKSTAEVSAFAKSNLDDALAGIEGVASVSSSGMIDDGVRIVLSQEKIDAVNKKVSAAINAEFKKNEKKVKSGIGKVKSGSKKIKKGKKQVKGAYSQVTSTLSQMKESRKALEAQKLREGITPEEIAIIDAQIAALDEAIDNLEDQKDIAGFELSTTYSDLASTQSTLDSTVGQLQGTLSQIESAKQAALDSADMTGVITMENVSAILGAQNFSMPAGYIQDDDAKILVSVGDKIEDVDEMENLILFDMGIKGVDPIRLRDIGTISYLADETETYTKINGDNGILYTFTKQSSYATATVSSNINKKFDELIKENEGLHFTALMDQGQYIHMVINSVMQSLLLGALLAIVILLFFLRDIRPTIITAISIPVSVLFALAAMYFSGVTLNMISLSGLAIGIGMLVDNSIVVIENTYRLRSLGYSVVQAAVSGASQVAGAITASTLTTICVFLPIVFVSGITKDIFVDLALTVTYSLLASLIIALTLAPAMAKGLLTKTPKKTVLGPGSRFVTKYKSAAGWCLRHKVISVICAFALLVASSGILLVKGFEFMPEMASPQLTAHITMPEDSTIQETAATNDALIKEVQKIDGVETVGAMLSSNAMSMFGMSNSGGDQNTTESSFYVVLDEKKAENSELVDKKLNKLAKKYNCEITTSASMDTSSMAGGTGISLGLYGKDLDEIRTTGAAIEERLESVKGLEEISDIGENSTEELRIVVNKNEAMKHGLTVAQVYQQIAAKLTKDKASTSITKDGASIDVSVGNSTADTFTRQDLDKMELTTKGSDNSTEKIKLTKIATISKDYSLSSISHSNQNRVYTVSANVKSGYNVTKMTSKVKKILDEEDMIPDGVTVKFDGANEDIMHSMKQMLLMLVIGFVLVYLVMVAQFQSLRSPLIIIFTIPLAFTGGMLALLLTNQVLSVVAMMGFVMLTGIVVNNGIVLVDCINRFRLEGMDTDTAIMEAGSIRMRPVIMTAATTILGLLPLAAGFGQGGEMVQPVAITCIGGLLYATITTLLIIPIMYKVFSRKEMVKISDEELEIVEA